VDSWIVVLHIFMIRSVKRGRNAASVVDSDAGRLRNILKNIYTIQVHGPSHGTRSVEVKISVTVNYILKARNQCSLSGRTVCDFQVFAVKCDLHGLALSVTLSP
jgi:hypothetical protein